MATDRSGALQDGIKEGDVVWANTESGLPKWPCIVKQLSDKAGYTIISFGDNIVYVKKSVEAFTERHDVLIKKARKSLKRKPSYLTLFNQAIDEALKYMQLEPNTDLNISAPDNSTLASSSSLVTTTPDSSFAAAEYTDNETQRSFRKRRASSRSQLMETPGESLVLSSTPTIGEGRHCLESRPKRTNIDSPSMSANGLFGNASVDQSSVPDTPNLENATPQVRECDTTTSSQDESVAAPDSSMTSQDEPYDQDSDSSDELPCVSFTDSEWSAKYLQPNNIVWVKYQKYPFWPSLVDRINRKKDRIRVYFLGWPDKHSVPISLKSRNKFAAYTYDNVNKYKTECQATLVELDIVEEFNQAMKEAEDLQQLRVKKEIEGSPRSQFKFIARTRLPSFYEKVRKEHKPHHEDQDTSLEEAEPQQPGEDDDNESDISRDWNEEEELQEDTSSPYCYSRIREHFEQMESILKSICLGQTHSDLHETYFNGRLKEKNAMKFHNKFGPVSLSDTQRSNLLKYLGDVAKRTNESCEGFRYSYDVLLPEAMVRTICTIENCTMDEAWRKLNT